MGGDLYRGADRLGKGRRRGMAGHAAPKDEVARRLADLIAVAVADSESVAGLSTQATPSSDIRRHRISIRARLAA